jgi:hypothetical protein
MIFFSCKKEDLSDTGKPAITGTPLLSKILTDNQSTNEYIYNDLNLIADEKGKYDFTRNHYDGKGQLLSTEYYGNEDILSSDAQVYQSALNSKVWVTPENGVKGGRMIYDYNDKGQLIKTTYSRPLSTSIEYSVFSYDASNRINKQTMYWDGTTTGYIDYSYDAKGNLIKEMLYNLPSAGAAEQITTIQYNFDTQQNPYKSSVKSLIPGVYTNPNNIIKETYTIHLVADLGSDKVQITESSYTYNGFGYPVTKNGNVSYIYK